MTAVNNEYRNCYYGNEGSIYFLVNSYLSDKGSRYISIAGKIGGAISCQ